MTFFRSIFLLAAALIGSATPAHAGFGEWFWGGGNYTYDGPCPPARPPILDCFSPDPNSCPQVAQCYTLSSACGIFGCPRSGCLNNVDQQREAARQEYMNAQIVCRTEPPPTVPQVCDMYERGGRGASLPGGNSIPADCVFYCDVCLGQHPDDTAGDLQEINDALRTVNSTASTALWTFFFALKNVACPNVLVPPGADIATAIASCQAETSQVGSAFACMASLVSAATGAANGMSGGTGSQFDQSAASSAAAAMCQAYSTATSCMAVYPPAAAAMASVPMLAGVSAACAAGQMLEKHIRCYGGPFGDGAYQSCANNLIDESPFLPYPRNGSPY